MESNGFPEVAVTFIARGAQPDWRLACDRFLRSYAGHRAGIPHALHVIFKGFSGPHDFDHAREMFGRVAHVPVCLDDDSYDIGAYIEWAGRIQHAVICCLNSSSEILADDWLLKLRSNLAVPGVGLVGATGSYESLKSMDRLFPKFPNVHIRSNAFMIDRRLFCEVSRDVRIADKLDAYKFESGPDGLTRAVLRRGLKPVVVGRNGRGYSPEWWVTSDTFRQGRQDNLLIGDNQTRNFMALPFAEKHRMAVTAWGRFLQEQHVLRRGLLSHRYA